MNALPTAAQSASQLTAKDWASDQDTRWCPGCGDYAILAQVKKVMPTLGVTREKTVFVSGIGCSSRFPYYMNTYGFHTIHGRAPAIATGLKAARPDLTVWIVTGDGDALSIGGNHLIHTLRRNVDVKILLFNNRIYGLTKGQVSPTSEFGKKTKSTPWGNIDEPLHPIALALGAEATFVARTVDVHTKHLEEVIRRAAAHRGSAFVEIYQNCNIFNDEAFAYATDKETRDDSVLSLEHGKPLVYGKDRDKGLRFKDGQLEVVKLGDGVSESDLVVHDEKQASGVLAYMMSRLEHPLFPEPMGVFRAIERPIYGDLIRGQVQEAKAKRGEGDLRGLLNGGATWTVTE